MKITSGIYKNKKTKGMDSIRSTKSIVRSAIFNILFSRFGSEFVKDSVVLDMFCGSGILSFEAISRGAKRCILNDLSTSHLDVAIENAKLINVLDKIEITNQDASKFVYKNLDADLVMIDPPFLEDKNTLPFQSMAIRTVENLKKIKCKHKDLVLVVELCKQSMLEFCKKYGDEGVKQYGKSYLKIMTI